MTEAVNTPWYALYVTREFRAQRELREAGVETFLPTYQQIKGHGKLRRLEPAPLFSGYVFICCAPEALWTAKACESVVKVLSGLNGPRIVPLAAVEQVRALVASGRMDERLVRKARPRSVRARGRLALESWFEADETADIAEAA